VVLNRGAENINLAEHDWLGEMDDVLGLAEMNSGIVEMNGEIAAIFVQRESVNQTTNDSHTGNNTEGENQSGNENGTVDENNSTEEAPCPMMPCPSCSDGEEAVSSVDENDCAICTCKAVDENNESTSGESTSSSNLINDLRWVLAGLILMVVVAIVMIGRKPSIED